MGGGGRDGEALAKGNGRARLQSHDLDHPRCSRSPCDAARLSALPRDRPTEHGCRPRRLDDNRWPSDDVLDRAASCSDRQMQRLTLAAISGIAGLWREHQTQRIDDVRARLLPRTPLAKDTSHLGDRRNDPAFISRLINNRQIKPLSHRPNDTCQRQYRAGRRARDNSRNMPLSGSAYESCTPSGWASLEH